MRSFDRILFDNFQIYKYNVRIGGGSLENQSNNSDIIRFLEKVKILLSSGKYDFVPRRKNLQSLALHGLTIADARDEILGLVVDDYYKGPKRDFDTNRPGEIWEFKKNINGINFYVKVKIVNENGEDILKCLGFHEDEFYNR